MYVYIHSQSDPDLWTAGFYDPKGKWQPESDHPSEEAAGDRVAYLNGKPRPSPEMRAFYQTMIEGLDAHESSLNPQMPEPTREIILGAIRALRTLAKAQVKP